MQVIGLASNIYFDTRDFELIRHSAEKPDYKEKVRLQAYGKNMGGNRGGNGTGERREKPGEPGEMPEGNFAPDGETRKARPNGPMKDLPEDKKDQEE